MKYQLIVFDLDGTLADTSEGILNAHRHANTQMGRKSLSDEELDGVIGGPLLDNYKTRFGFNETDAVKAVSIYRDWYSKHGVYQAKLYDGMKETLTFLKQNGYKLAVATLKAESFAKQLLQDMGVANLFDIIYGVDKNDSRTKADLIKLCMSYTNCTAEGTVMIGDSIHDLQGAQECGVDFIGVSYGFGFKADGSNTDYCITPADILSVVKEL